MKKIAIIGASGHGKVVADIAKLNGYNIIGFFDDDVNKKTCGDYQVLGNCLDLVNNDYDVFVAIGNAEYRKKYIELYHDRMLPSLIHPSAVIADDVKMGVGTVVMAGAVINSGSCLGKGCIVNTCSSVDHDCMLGDYVHVAVGAHLSGTVSIGNETWIGAGGIVINNISICSQTIIGAGAVVINDIDDFGVYVGIPARKLERINK